MAGEMQISIGGQKYSINNLPKDVRLEDIDDEKLRKALELFDFDENKGVLTEKELEKVSLFFQTGEAKIETQEEDGSINVLEIIAKKAGKLPTQMLQSFIDGKDRLVSFIDTQFKRNMNVKRTDEYKYERNDNNNDVTIIHDTINSKDELVQTEVSKKQNHYTKTTDTYEYKNHKNGRVDVAHTHYNDGVEEKSKYHYYTDQE